jgi:hypothetical protein
MALAAQLIFLLFFCASLAVARPAWPTSAQAGPSPGRHLPLATEATAALPSRCRTTHHHRPPSRTRMERNRSAAWPPSLSRTSSTPHRLLSRIQCRNRRGLKIHRRRPPPLPSPPLPPQVYKRPPSYSNTSPHLVQHLVSLLRAPFALSPKLIPPRPYCLITGQVVSAPPPSNFMVRFPKQPSSFWSSHSEVWHLETPPGMSSDEPLGHRRPESNVDHWPPIHGINTLGPHGFSL